ncbi:MAG TPA: serine hydrolase domain-containing protein [Methyloceanibacter sp.]|jgi:CubicO group peptidase (beta-lactamase class C family)|nr:serine hydrolase domain-containing protein [Methyloceanibacter sp.]
MSDLPLRLSRLVLALAVILAGNAAAASPRAAPAVDPAGLERGLDIRGSWWRVSLDEAMKTLNVPSVSVALIESDNIAFVRAYGQGATPETLYQAASLSKFVAAVGAMRLVDQKKLALDEDVNAKLTSWKVPTNGFDEDHPVTLRGLLSMTAGIGVPGFLGYAAGVPLPNLTQILYGAPPANSPPVTVIAQPGNAYAYSGGGYQIAEALMSDSVKAPFPQAMAELVLNPAGMERSSFAQPLPRDREKQAARGHDAKGEELTGRWHVFPEHAAAGLWSTPTDLANLLLLVGRAWRGQSGLFLLPETAREMLKPQKGGPYGLGAAIGEAEGALVVMKRGQNVGYQAYLILFPAEGQGMVVMTNSDNGSVLAEALIRRAAQLYGWPELGPLQD